MYAHALHMYLHKYMCTSFNIQSSSICLGQTTKANSDQLRERERDKSCICPLALKLLSYIDMCHYKHTYTCINDCTHAAAVCYNYIAGTHTNLARRVDLSHSWPQAEASRQNRERTVGLCPWYPLPRLVAFCPPLLLPTTLVPPPSPHHWQ